jgi:hypothetical protein
MRRGLSFSFPLLVGIMFCLAILAMVFSSVHTEGQQEQLMYFITSSLDDNGGHDLYHGSTFIKELENLVKNFEYTFDIEGKQIFPTNNTK